MNKDILLSITGLHFTDTEDEESAPVEVITPGQYYNRNGKHYIIYDEIAEDVSGNTKTRIKIDDMKVEIKKQGDTSTKLTFERGKQNLSCYHTPYGDIMFGVCTRNIDFHETPNELTLEIDYTLEANYEPMSECHLRLLATDNSNTLFHTSDKS